MSGLLKQSSTLEDLRIADFEQTQLLTLSVEQEALSCPFRLSANPRSEQRREVIWHARRHWYQILWLCVYPFLLWARDFSGVIAQTVVKHRHHLTRSKLRKHRWDLLKWIFFLILAPLLAVLSVVWNLCFYLFPGAIHAIMESGASLVNAKGMYDNIDVQIALEEMAIGEIGNYSHAIAEYLCLVSAISYTRSPAKYARAQKVYRDLVAVDGKVLPTEPVLHSHPIVRRRILQIMNDSEAQLREHARAIGLEAAVISELDTGLGGPVASLFVSKEHHVIIIGISGTNPYDFRDVLVDAAFAKVAASKSFFPFLKNSKSANLHRGFYSSLFPLTEAKTYPAKRIKEAILAQAKLMRASHTAEKPVNVYITGHSLGAATASIFASSLTDLGPDVNLCDVYVYGTPMNSDATFCRAFDREISIWRIINGQDFVTRIPPSINLLASEGGIGDMATAEMSFEGTILDYSAIGHGIRFGKKDVLPDGLDDTRGDWTCNVEPDGKVETVWWVWLFGHTPLRRFVQHSTISYSATLKAARAFLVEYDG